MKKITIAILVVAYSTILMAQDSQTLQNRVENEGEILMKSDELYFTLADAFTKFCQSNGWKDEITHIKVTKVVPVGNELNWYWYTSYKTKNTTSPFYFRYDPYNSNIGTYFIPDGFPKEFADYIDRERSTQPEEIFDRSKERAKIYLKELLAKYNNLADLKEDSLILILKNYNLNVPSGFSDTLTKNQVLNYFYTYKLNNEGERATFPNMRYDLAHIFEMDGWSSLFVSAGRPVIERWTIEEWAEKEGVNVAEVNTFNYLTKKLDEKYELVIEKMELAKQATINELNNHYNLELKTERDALQEREKYKSYQYFLTSTQNFFFANYGKTMSVIDVLDWISNVADQDRQSWSNMLYGERVYYRREIDGEVKLKMYDEDWAFLKGYYLKYKESENADEKFSFN